MKKPKNPKKTCRICGGKCKANVRFCALCARDRKKAAGAKEVQRFKTDFLSQREKKRFLRGWDDGNVA